MNPFRLAFLSLTRRKISTTIALLAIAISVASSGMLLRLYLLSGARFSEMAEGPDAIVGAKSGGIEVLLGSLNLEGDFPGFLPNALFEALRRQTAVRFEDGSEESPSSIRSLIPFVYFGRFKNFRVIGTDPSFLNQRSKTGQISLQKGRWIQSQGEIVLGAEVARVTNVELGESLRVEVWTGDEPTRHLSHEKTHLDLKVVGVLSSTKGAWDRGIYSSVQQAHDAFKKVAWGHRSIWGGEVLHYYLAYLEPGGFSSLRSLIDHRTVGQIISVSEQKKKLQELTGTGWRLGIGMSSFILLLGGLSVAGMLVARFDGMNTQFAVLRALGYKKAEVGSWLLWEGFLLGVTGCVLGAMIDGMAFPVLKSLLGAALPQTEWMRMPLYQSYPVWFVAVFATTAAVFIPLWRLYRQDVHFSLQGGG
jgi:putative ABC transport system permease protein